jgi:uncharacterized protein YecE (DUF72 family)
MKFGKLADKSVLDQIDFTLPDTDISERLSQRLVNDAANRSSEFEIYVGAPAWGVKDWVGKIYPPKTPTKDYLKFYAQAFNCIELNTSYYRLPSPKNIEDWKAETGSEFLFCPKVTKEISHLGGMNNPFIVQEYFEGIRQFLPNLGITFLQLNETFSPLAINELAKFLQLIPDDINVAVEFRHSDWFKPQQKIFNYLEQKNVATVITDTAGNREIMHCKLTSDTAMIRFVGNELHHTDFSRIDSWITKLQEWKELGLKRVYFFVHEADEIACPEVANYFNEKAEAAGLAQIKEMKFYNQPEAQEQASFF